MRLSALLACLAPLVAAGSALAFDMPQVEPRLLVAGGLDGGVYRAGLEIDLPDGWHTYWTDPGDAGIPPVIDAAASANLAAFAVAYPVPKRYSDGVSTSMIYEGRLLLPLELRPATADQPVDLRLAVSFGLCRDVCLPVSAEIDVRLAPDAAADAAAASAIANASGKVPQPDAGTDDRLAVRKLATDTRRGEATAEVSVADGGDLVDLFASAPAPWMALPPEGAGRDGDRALYRVTLYGPSGATPDGVTLTFIRLGRSAATTFARRLD